MGSLDTMVRTAASQLADIFRSHKSERYTIFGLILVNVVFIFVHVAHIALFRLGYVPENLNLRLDHDNGYSEIFNYLQAIAAATLLFYAFVVSGQRIYMAWALVLAFVAFDDALLIHERLGGYLDDVFTLPALPGLRPQDTGELIVWGIAGAFLLLFLVSGFRSSTPEAVGFGFLLALLFALLGFFAVGVDMLHIAMGSAFRFAEPLLTIVEDGGEMLAVALICACSLLLCRRLNTMPSASGRGTAI